MSFISDSTMGMDKSDSGGSIQQPLVEQEVIPIGGSSSEGTCHETSHNPVGGHNLLLLLCTRSLLPLSASRAMKMIGGRDVRVYPSNKHSHTIGSPSSPLVVVGYEWVRDDVLKYRSSITSTTSVAHWGVN